MFKHNGKPVFYGWFIVAASFFIAMYGGGMIFYGFTTFFEPIVEEFGWSYAQVSLAASLRGLEMGILSPLTGILVDRYGSKAIIRIGAVLGGLGLLLLSSVQSLPMFYISFVLIALGGSCCAQTVLMAVIVNWFRKKLSMATGITLSGFGFGGLLVLPLTKLIEIYDWRITMVLMAASMLLLFIPLSQLFRHKPEQYGYLPDGDTEATKLSPAEMLTLQAEANTGIKDKLKTATFWKIAMVYVFYGALLGGIFTHIMPYLSEIHMDRTTAALITAILPPISIIGRVGWGWLGDRFNHKLTAAGSFLMIFLGMLCFGYASIGGYWLLLPFMVLFGIGYGGANTMRTPLTREFLGKDHFGAMFGLIMGISMIGNLAGPLVAGLAHDTWGSYQFIWLVLAVLPLLAGMFIITVSPVKARH